MNCQRAERLFSLLLDGELSPADKISIEEHFEACAACKRSYQEFIHTLDMVHSLPRLEAPEGFAGSVLDRIRSRAPVTVDPWWRRLGWQLADWTEWLRVRPAYATAAATVLVVVGALAVWQLRPAGESTQGMVAQNEGRAGGTTSELEKETPEPTAEPGDEAPAAPAEERVQEGPGTQDRAPEPGQARQMLVQKEPLQAVPDSLFDHEYDFEFAFDRYYFQRLPGDSGLTPARPFPETKGRTASITF